MKTQIQTLLTTLNHGLIQREETLKTALLTVLAGENLVLIGPPGTGKSMIARRIAACFGESGKATGQNACFEYLLTKFSTPEEIFGPLSITELKADRFRRNTAGYLPSVKIAFLDEIFKASSSILNALLTILNERIYHNGAEPQQIPLQALIAASNELPDGQEELAALYDRFLVRSFVDYVSPEDLPRLFESVGEMAAFTGFDDNDLRKLQHAAERVTLPQDIRKAIQEIWMRHREVFKEDNRESLSDRRLKKVVKLLCVSAATNGRQEVDLSDLLLLKNCLWNHQENALKVRELIIEVLRSFSHPVPQTEMKKLGNKHEPITYELLEDGKTLAPVNHSLTVTSSIQSRPKAVVKGYKKGSGTAEDPFLIETLDHLSGLERPEVGQQGYWFRQTTDIDASILTTWLNIFFKGHYDGDGHTITGTGEYLFTKIQESTLTRMRLEDAGLAEEATDCKISTCRSSGTFINTATDCDIAACESESSLMLNATGCTISHCESDRSMVMGNATSSTISYCRSGGPLISKRDLDKLFNNNYGGVADACTIKDCQVQVDGMWCLSEDVSIGGIATEIQNNSVVECCFVTGKISVDRHNIQNKALTFSGIASACDGGAIRQCAIGAFRFESRDYYHWATARMERRIGGGAEYLMSLMSLKANPLEVTCMENNVALDSNPGTSDPNGPDGKSLPSALFTQNYFENTLNWDFDTVWQWNAANKQPELRSVGVGVVLGKSRHTQVEESGGMVDLLTQQMLANIWL